VVALVLNNRLDLGQARGPRGSRLTERGLSMLEGVPSPTSAFWRDGLSRPVVLFRAMPPCDLPPKPRERNSTQTGGPFGRGRKRKRPRKDPQELRRG